MTRNILVTTFHNKPVEHVRNFRMKAEVFESNYRNDEFLKSLFIKFFLFDFTNYIVEVISFLMYCGNFDEDFSKLGFESLFSSTRN